MTNSDPVDAVEQLHTRSPRRIWGLSSESIYTALAAMVDAERLADRLAPHIHVETLRTNDERDHASVITVHEWILTTLGLYSEGEVTLLGAFVLTADSPQSLIQSICVARLPSAKSILRSCAAVDDSLPRREFNSLLADEWDETILGPLLGSLGFVTIYPDSVEPDHDQIWPTLAGHGETSTEEATAGAYAHILPEILTLSDKRCLDDLVERTSGTALTESSSPEAIATSLAHSSQKMLDATSIRDAVAAQRDQYQRKFSVLRSLIVPSDDRSIERIETDDTEKLDELITGDRLNETECEFLVNVVATVASHPEFSRLDIEFITDRLDTTPYEAFQLVSSIPGVKCEVADDDVLVIDALPVSIVGTDLKTKYTSHLLERCAAVQGRIGALRDVSVSCPPSPVAAEEMIAQTVKSLNDGDVAPAYFTYTLIDPDALGEQVMDTYVGESRGLGREQARLRRWHENRPLGLKSYTSMTDRLFSYGLERELDDRVLRIMTPFDDDTFHEYVAQVRRLLERGFELRLLTRHTKEPWEWRRLQENLLSEIKDQREQVIVRTYSRFKKLQRVSPDMDFRKLGEFGIHGKLQTIGRPGKGAALLGSANFMENSYNWNPECGVYTEQTQFVGAAIEFFDIVWDISEADELSIARLQEIPEHQLVPTHYHY